MTTLPNKMVLLQLVATVLLCFIGNSNGASVLQAEDNDRIRQVDDRQVGGQRRRHLRRDPGGSGGPTMKNKPDCGGPGRLSPYCSQPTPTTFTIYVPFLLTNYCHTNYRTNYYYTNCCTDIVRRQMCLRVHNLLLCNGTNNQRK